MGERLIRVDLLGKRIVFGEERAELSTRPLFPFNNQEKQFVRYGAST